MKRQAPRIAKGASWNAKREPRTRVQVTGFGWWQKSVGRIAARPRKTEDVSSPKEIASKLTRARDGDRAKRCDTLRLRTHKDRKRSYRARVLVHESEWVDGACSNTTEGILIRPNRCPLRGNGEASLHSKVLLPVGAGKRCSRTRIGCQRWESPYRSRLLQLVKRGGSDFRKAVKRTSGSIEGMSTEAGAGE